MRFLVLIFLTALSAATNAQPVITSLTTNLVVTNGGTALFNVAFSDNEAVGYQWQFNGTNIPNSGTIYPTISTVAGGGAARPGNGGLATNAAIHVWSVRADAAGNVYNVSAVDEVIQKIDTNGIITTVAGNGGFGFSGDGGRPQMRPFVNRMGLRSTIMATCMLPTRPIIASAKSAQTESSIPSPAMELTAFQATADRLPTLQWEAFMGIHSQRIQLEIIT
jgi:hypothetical protein